jgi:hypothetical protein
MTAITWLAASRCLQPGASCERESRRQPWQRCLVGGKGGCKSCSTCQAVFQQGSGGISCISSRPPLRGLCLDVGCRRARHMTTTRVQVCTLKLLPAAQCVTALCPSLHPPGALQCQPARQAPHPPCRCFASQATTATALPWLTLISTSRAGNWASSAWCLAVEVQVARRLSLWRQWRASRREAVAGCEWREGGGKGRRQWQWLVIDVTAQPDGSGNWAASKHSQFHGGSGVNRLVLSPSPVGKG